MSEQAPDRDRTLSIAQALLARHIDVGDIVDVSEVIGEQPTVRGVRVTDGPAPLRNGDWVVRVEQLGTVSVLAVMPSTMAGVARKQAYDHIRSIVEPAVSELFPLAPGTAASLTDSIAGHISTRIIERPCDFLHGIGYRLGSASAVVTGSAGTEQEAAPVVFSKLDDARLKEWASGRPSNPITSDGIMMAIELLELRRTALALASQGVSEGTRPVNAAMGRLDHLVGKRVSSAMVQAMDKDAALPVMVMLTFVGGGDLQVRSDGPLMTSDGTGQWWRFPIPAAPAPGTIEPAVQCQVNFVVRHHRRDYLHDDEGPPNLPTLTPKGLYIVVALEQTLPNGSVDHEELLTDIHIGRVLGTAKGVSDDRCVGDRLMFMRANGIDLGTDHTGRALVAVHDDNVIASVQAPTQGRK